jgi:hypothetical protein
MKDMDPSRGMHAFALWYVGDSSQKIKDDMMRRIIHRAQLVGTETTIERLPDDRWVVRLLSGDELVDSLDIMTFDLYDRAELWTEENRLFRRILKMGICDGSHMCTCKKGNTNPHTIGAPGCKRVLVRRPYRLTDGTWRIYTGENITQEQLLKRFYQHSCGCWSTEWSN